MKKISSKMMIPDERIIRRILLVRNEKVMLDVHLAELYGVETRTLKQAVRRNLSRFPPDFMYTLTRKEVETVVSQNVIPHKKFLGGAAPYAFTEAGVAMLSSVLKSDEAVKMNVAIVRTFVAIRKIAISYKDLKSELEKFRKETNSKFKDIFSALEYLLAPEEQKKVARKRIGFKQDHLE